MILTTETQDQPPSLFEQSPRWLNACLVLMFVLAALLRQNELRLPGDLIDREYTSAIFARAYYYMHNPDVEDWRRDIALMTKNQHPVLEPPLLEYLVSLIYRMVGKEEIFYARYLTNAFWVIGGVIMYLIAKHLLGTDAAIIATAYYLFVPKSVIISRSFQPDSLMMMLFLLSLYLIIRYFDQPTTVHLLCAACITGITLLLRPLVLFAIFCAYLALSIQKKENSRNIGDVHLIIFSALSLMPSALYYGYGIVFAGFMRWKIPTSFMPHLLTKWDFWQGWFELGAAVVGPSLLILAVVGFFFIRNKIVQYLVIGLAIGYVIFGIAFTYHIHTHGYYHIQLFPVIALCIAPLVAGVLRGLLHLPIQFRLIPVFAVILITLYFSYPVIRDDIYSFHFEDPRIAREIGEIVHHSPRTVFVAYHYGIPLEYYGELSGLPWPVRIESQFYRRPDEQERSVQDRLDSLGFAPEYFVITYFDLFYRKHQDLQAYLQEACSVYAQTENYLIYNGCLSKATQ